MTAIPERHRVALPRTAHLLRRMVQAGALDLPAPGAGATAQRWDHLLGWGRADLPLARLAEGHTDALAILAEAGADPAARARSTACGRPVPAAPAPSWSRSGAATLRGTVRFCSGAHLLDRALVVAATPDGIAGGRPRPRPPGVRPSTAAGRRRGCGTATRSTSSWPTSRWPRGTCSGRPGWYTERLGFWWGGGGVAAVWLGGALGVLDALRAAAAGRAPDPFRLAHLGALHAVVGGDRALLAAHRGRRSTPTPDEPHRTAVWTLRSAVERTCRDVLELAPRAAGVAALTRSPLGQQLADLRPLPPPAPRRARPRRARAGGPGRRGRGGPVTVRELTAPEAWRAALAAHPRPAMDPRVGRLLVVAAHPDDETLGAGGFLRAAHAAGGRVAAGGRHRRRGRLPGRRRRRSGRRWPGPGAPSWTGRWARSAWTASRCTGWACRTPAWPTSRPGWSRRCARWPPASTPAWLRGCTTRIPTTPPPAGPRWPRHRPARTASATRSGPGRGATRTTRACPGRTAVEHRLDPARPAGQAPGRRLPHLPAAPGPGRRGADPAGRPCWPTSTPSGRSSSGSRPDAAPRRSGSRRSTGTAAATRGATRTSWYERRKRAVRAGRLPAAALPARRRAGLRNRRAHPASWRPVRPGDGQRLHGRGRGGHPRGHRGPARGHGASSWRCPTRAARARRRRPRGVQRGALLPGRGRSRPGRRADRRPPPVPVRDVVLVHWTGRPPSPRRTPRRPTAGSSTTRGSPRVVEHVDAGFLLHVVRCG